MERPNISGLVFAAAFAAGITTMAQGQEPRPSSPAAARAADRTVTVVGCLVRETPPGSSTASTNAAPMYRLTSVQPAGGAPAGSPTASRGQGAGTPSTPPTAGASEAGRSASSMMETEYRIVAGADVGNLAPHVNHRMQLTGTVSPRPGRGAEAGARGRGSDATTERPSGANPDATNRAAGQGGQGRGRAGGMADVATLNVTSMTMVAASCP